MNIHFLGVLGYQPYREKHTVCIMMPEYGIVLEDIRAWKEVQRGYGEHVSLARQEMMLPSRVLQRGFRLSLYCTPLEPILAKISTDFARSACMVS